MKGDLKDIVKFFNVMPYEYRYVETAETQDGILKIQIQIEKILKKNSLKIVLYVSKRAYNHVLSLMQESGRFEVASQYPLPEEALPEGALNEQRVQHKLLEDKKKQELK